MLKGVEMSQEKIEGRVQVLSFSPMPFLSVTPVLVDDKT